MSQRKVGEVFYDFELFNAGKTFTEPSLHSLAEEADSNIPDVKLKAIQSVRKLFSPHRNPPIDEIINSKLLSILVRCLETHDNPTLQFEAVWILKNITSGSFLQTQAVVFAEAVPLILNLFNSPHQAICEQAVWAIGNIMVEFPQLRDLLISLNIMARLLLLVNHSTPVKLMRNVARVMVNLCRNQDSSIAEQHVISELLLVLSYLINNEDTIIVEDTVLAISYLANGSNYQKQKIFESGIIIHVIPLLSHKDEKISKLAIQFLSNITIGNPTKQHNNINISIISRMQLPKRTLDENASVIKKPALSDSSQKENCVNANRIIQLCALLSHQDGQLIKVVLKCLQNMLETTGSRVEILLVCILIEKYGGLDEIERLQHHENVEIYKLAYDIIERYFLGQTHFSDS